MPLLRGEQAMEPWASHPFFYSLATYLIHPFGSFVLGGQEEDPGEVVV
jgi:hypothetical protein